MSNALPLGFLRPSCAALRSSTPTLSRRLVTTAFTRRFTSHTSDLIQTSGSPLSSLLRLHKQPASNCQRRPFSSSPQWHSRVVDMRKQGPTSESTHAARKRAVRIGPLPDGNVPIQIISQIFGPGVSQADGNNVLRILHHRRTSGSLVDYGVGNLGARYANVKMAQANKALEWLREKYPVNEAQAAEAWAEREANRIAYELWLADPENQSSKHNDPARVWREQQQELKDIEEEESRKIGMLHAGPSQFDRNIEEKRRKRLEAMAKKAEEEEKKQKEFEEKLKTGEYIKTPSGKQLMKPNQEVYVDVFGREQVSRFREEYEKYSKLSQTEFKTEEEMLQATTLTQRLVPMTCLVVAIVTACYAFGHYWEPPTPEYRLWSDLSLTTATLTAIIATNVFIFFAWKVMPLWPLMTKYFMLVPGYPRAAQAIFTHWSHLEPTHLFSNMLWLIVVGTVCHDLVGRGIFMSTYVSAGALGTLAGLYWHNIGPGSRSVHTVGASAAVWCIGVLYCLLTDKDTLKVPFIKDFEVGFYPKTLLAVYVLMEIYAMTRKRMSKLDHVGHFTGMAVGASVAGYQRATGFYERRREIQGGDGVEDRVAGGEEQTVVDIGALVSEEVKEVKEGIKKLGKGEEEGERRWWRFWK
ncbi:hypothetical protein M011DRAFT_426979 [Sporormia fimetaria CBS 119925]|uniref:Peptidase S54 rhomboid domain-containing protein n=1 Tax=Sporormia fimetaria CBS 119925 TaxID=1340428 RepID=A0A6A6V5P6_9PLEO|nr:hypothetical protein M011DRAFT_426979 [Sporormia fimetaria CBS 119925]